MCQAQGLEREMDSLSRTDLSESGSCHITGEDMKDKLVKEQVRRDANNARERSDSIHFKLKYSASES